MFSQRFRAVVLPKCKRTFSKCEFKSLKELTRGQKFAVSGAVIGAGVGVYQANEASKFYYNKINKSYE